MLALPARGNVIIEETMFVLAGISPMANMISVVGRTKPHELTNTVTRSRGDLEAVGQGLPSTIVDEVVGRGERFCLICFIGSNLVTAVVERSALNSISAQNGSGGIIICTLVHVSMSILKIRSGFDQASRGEKNRQKC